MAKKQPLKSEIDSVNNEIPESNPVIVNSNPVSDIPMPGGDNSEANAFDKSSLERLKQNVENREPKKRGARGQKVPAKEFDVSTIKPLLVPLFKFSGSIMKSRGIREFSPEEIEQGCEAWAPLAAKYLPHFEEYAIYLAPILWTSGIVMSRLEEKAQEKMRLEENKKEEKNASEH